MRIKKIIKLTTILLCLCILAGTGLFMYNANNSYGINSEFMALPLNFNPDDSSSSYKWHETNVTVNGGFIKGIQSGKDGDSLVIRALSPLPSIEISTPQYLSVQNVSITLENINPDYYAASIDSGLNPSRIAVNTLEFHLNSVQGETIQIVPTQPNKTEDDNYVILGDSRDGYETFDEIIAQVNEIDPVFAIDNGDLVFSGKPNQYRLFDQAVSGFATTVCTTLGNHDIRGNGRETYIKLYGPEYYSFDFGSNHFIFLDSSRGYAEKQAIPEEQYAWLEKDLQKAQGNRIYVISHVPSTDPRSGVQPNEIEAYTDEVKQQGNFIEQKLEAYSENESIDHGFRDKQEAIRFENLMTQYKVDTVYLSHIHSYYDYSKDAVRYIISGGAGAELLTQNSYYHYLIAKVGTLDSITMVQLPSPTNLLLQRYAATASLFAQAIYKENQAAVILFIAGFILLIILLLALLVMRHNHKLNLLWVLIKDTGKFISKRFRELYNKRE